MSLEWEIHQKLVELQDPAKVAESLATMWKERDLDLDDRIAIASFLLNSGRNQILLTLVVDTLKLNQVVPWGHLIESCRELGPSEEVVNAILEGAESQNQLDHLLRSSMLNRSSEKVRELFVRAESQRASEIQERRKSLLDKLEYLKSQRMFEAEGRAIQEFQNLFPTDAEFVEIKQSFEDRWSREIIQQKSTQSTILQTLPRFELKSAETTQAEQIIGQVVTESAKEFPTFAYDLAILLYFLEIYEPAKTALSFAPMNFACEWFGLELRLKGRQFVEALEEANRFESKYANNPESSFAATYARARALHGLGQTENAKELLKSVVQIRPDYRSAQVLLNDWSGGQF